MQTDKNKKPVVSNHYTPQFLLQVYSPLALAEATVVRVELDCQGHENLQKNENMLTKKELKNVNQSQNFPKAEPRNSELLM